MIFYIFIKNFFLFTLGYYTFMELNNFRHAIINYVKAVLYSILLAILATTISFKLSTLHFPLTLLFYFFALYIFSYNKHCFSFIYAIISISVSYTVLSVVTVPITLIFWIVYPNTIKSYISYITLVVGILSALATLVFMKHKRLKKAIYLLCNYNNFYTYAVLVFCFILLIIIAQAHFQSPGSSQLYVVSILIIAILLLYIIQRQTQKYYLAKLKKLELESLRQEIAEKDELIQKLQASNDHLARIIHKDNKLIPSMEAAVHRYLLNLDHDDADTLRTNGEALASELHQLAQDRQGILTGYNNLQNLPRTGHAGIDAILSHMRDRAHALHIEYKIMLGADFSDAVNRLIPEADLVHLLSDLIENALIATKGCDKRTVLIHLDMLYDAPVVEISDTGKPFDPEVYQSFGLQKHSTHLEDGGSGIGLMDIWEIKKKYAASLHIHEYAPDTTPFTKKLSIVFDGRKHYLIRTYRPQDLLLYRTRTDMFILPLE